VKHFQRHWSFEIEINGKLPYLVDPSQVKTILTKQGGFSLSLSLHPKFCGLFIILRLNHWCFDNIGSSSQKKYDFFSPDFYVVGIRETHTENSKPLVALGLLFV